MTVCRVEVVALHVTQSCSHQCPFCYASSTLRSFSPPYNTVRRVLDAIADEGVREVVFLGGDPCEYPYLLELTKHAKSHGLGTTVLSNTHKYPDIREAVTSIDVFETTFHGPYAALHDSIAMREGAFEFVIQNLQRVVSAGVSSIGVVYNVLPQNAKLVYQTTNVLVERYNLPIDHLLIQRIIPQGRGQATSNKFSAGRQHILVLLEGLERISRAYPQIRISFEDPVPLCSVPAKFHKFLNKCRWGFTHAALDWQGNLSRCGADPRYGLGNVLEVPLQTIWNTSPTLKSFREYRHLPRQCKECPLLDKCGGGCALACEINADAGIDFLFFEVRSFQVGYGKLTFRLASQEDLSDILRIEWSCFPDYEYRFSVTLLKRWYAFNPKMFYVLEDGEGLVVGYACFVPLKEGGFQKIRSGEISSLSDLRFSDVVRDVAKRPTPYWHLEVIAASPNASLRARAKLVKEVKVFVEAHATVVTTSPITFIGEKLCKRFGFIKIAEQKTSRNIYPIYMLKVR